VQLGIAYTFQITSVFENLSCFENVRLAVQSADVKRGQSRQQRAIDQAVIDVLVRVGLAEYVETIARHLSYGHQRLLEVAMGLALRPRLLMLDEPTQGLSDPEIAEFIALIREISESATILLIEHNMDVVMELAETITVLESGRILAEGAPDSIRADKVVQQAYLGQ
jgi:branched-chain amino acid transport system ATP-binding protein